MTTLKLKVFPSEFIGMIRFMRTFAGDQQLPLVQQSLASLVLVQYLSNLKMERLLAWQYKPTSKAHPISLPLPVAKALHQEMQVASIDDWQMMFLMKLDQVLTNFRLPLTPLQLSH